MLFVEHLKIVYLTRRFSISELINLSEINNKYNNYFEKTPIALHMYI